MGFDHPLFSQEELDKIKAKWRKAFTGPRIQFQHDPIEDKFIEVGRTMGKDGAGGDGGSMEKEYVYKIKAPPSPHITITDIEIQQMVEDAVSHPSHYNQGKIEVIEFIEDQGLGFSLGNTIKYISRAGKKDPSKELEDLKKARWYLNRHIELIEAKKENREVTRPNDMNPQTSTVVQGVP